MMQQLWVAPCDHSEKKDVDENTSLCMICDEELCRHVEVDQQSNCALCGEYVQEISNERSWTANSYTYGNQTAKSQDHTKVLRTLGVDDEVIRLTMKKYSEIDNRMKNEIPVVAACTFLSFLDVSKPKTIHEISAMFNKATGDKLTRSKLQKALKAVYEVFPEYKTKYVTITSMVVPLMEKLKIDRIHYPHIKKIAKFAQKHWAGVPLSKRSTPQNICSIILYKYIFRSPTLKDKYLPAKVIKVLGVSAITLNNIEKTLDKLIDFT